LKTSNKAMQHKHISYLDT